jgi:hypothetical protein
MTPKNRAEKGVDLIIGDYLVRFEARTLDDIRAFGGNDEEDDRKFAAAARVSEINLGLYRTFVQPWVRLCTNEGAAQLMRQLHPLRMQYEIFSRNNPFMSPLLSASEQVRKNRTPVSKDNAFWQAQTLLSDWIEASFNAYRDVCEYASESLFHSVYGSPALQALVGLKASQGTPRQRPGKDAAHRALVARRIGELRQAITQGGPREAMIRALLYVRTPDGAVDERGFNLLRRMRKETGGDLTLSEFKMLLREQFLMLSLDERRAVEAIPAMLAKDRNLASQLALKLRRLIGVVGVHGAESTARLAEIERFFENRREGSEDPSGENSQPAPVRALQAHVVGTSKR